MHNSIQSNQAKRIKFTFQTKFAASICGSCSDFFVKILEYYRLEFFCNIYIYIFLIQTIDE